MIRTLNIACFIVFWIGTSIGFSQSLDTIAQLSNTMKESSGLIYFSDRLITFNDSGNDASLYEVNQQTGAVERKVVVANATNKDWEAITEDDEYIYIADFGNNAGSRTDLTIYKVEKGYYLTTPNDTVYAELISFSYENQVDFTPNNNQTNFDAEAMVVVGDSLYIFTKQWLNRKTSIYRLPKNAGTYSAQFVKELAVNFLVTDATYDADFHGVLLIGYWANGNYLAEIGHIGQATNLFSAATFVATTIPTANNVVLQLEGLTKHSTASYYVTSEEGNSKPARLFQLFYEPISADSKLISQNDFKIQLVNHQLIIEGEFLEGYLYNSMGQIVKKITNSITPVNDLKFGTYWLQLANKQGATTLQRIMLGIESIH